MTAQYVPRASDLAYYLPEPRAYGWAFARSMDPGGAALVTAVLLRDGLVYLMRDNPNHRGLYVLDAETRGSATGGASTVAGNAAGVPLAVFLSEMNFRWRTWAADNGIDPADSAGGPAYGGPVWVGEGEALATLQAAATAWGWLPL